MAHEEKSRDAFDPRKRYAAVGMQQGRVLLDDDFNEAERIRIEEDRRVNLDVIGPVGSPDGGFVVSKGTITGGGCDLEIAAGTLYLGGLRLWNPVATPLSRQDDWLQQTATDRPAPTEGRIDLAYLEAWQQPVTAVEDTELFEVALGGPDSSTRLRTMWRVHLASATDDDCPGAWKTLVAGWKAGGLGTIDGTGERVVDTSLEVTYSAGQPGDLCTPKIAGGYLGADNQTLRVQLVDAGHFTWGYDNGAPLYQATIGADRKTITLLGSPRDRAHWPIAGQVVEILPWSAVLPNHEKLASATGHLARIASSFDPDPSKHAFVLTDGTKVPAGFGDGWKARSDAGDLGDTKASPCFVRIWDRGDDVTSDLAITVGPGAVPLGTTGINVTITGSARVAGDHWIIAARPRTPDQVVPWSLEDGRAPHGVRRFYAPLALIQWHADGTFDVLHDCRPTFLPLTRQRGCCTYTVGDGEHSHGQFRSINAALAALPADGGKVCVLPGIYDETVIVDQKKNVTIEGCGKRSRLRPGAKQPWTIVVSRSRGITIKDLAVEADDRFGIVLGVSAKGGVPDSVDDVAWMDGRVLVRDVLLDGLTITASERSAIAAYGGKGLVIRDCDVTIEPLDRPIQAGDDAGRWPAVLSFADDVVIEDNRIVATVDLKVELTTAAGAVKYTHTGLGGIQIGGGSERVEIRRNKIVRGNGDGVTLGSWAWAPKKLQLPELWADLIAVWIWRPGISIHINDEGCIEVEWHPRPPDGPDGTPMVPVSMGDVVDVRIIDNDILSMGKSGVGVARFFDLSGEDELIVVRGLEIRDNRIVECLRLPIPAVPADMIDVAGQGAITLAEVEGLVVRGNDIHDNGKLHIDPVCGVFALVSVGAVIEHNRIVDNAPHAQVEDAVRRGWRGGVVLVSARPPGTPISMRGRKADVVRMNGEPSARITDNVIVVPEGRAIVVIASGPVVIADNELMVRGVARADIAAAMVPTSSTGGFGSTGAKVASLQGILDLIGGVAVTVIDIGFSNELLWAQLMFYSSQLKQDTEPKPGLDARAPVAASGQIMFVDNQVGVDLLAAPDNLVLSAVALITLDDVACADNQIEIDRQRDLMVMTALVLGTTARVTSNRVKESLVDLSSLFGVSIYSIGALLNTTTENQTSRCIAALGAKRVVQQNLEMIELIDPYACSGTAQATGKLQKQMMSNRGLAITGTEN